MGEAEVVVEYTDYDEEEDTVESVTVVKTDDDEYPSGWKYRLHYGTVDGETLVRYDNSHEKQKGHENTPATKHVKSNSVRWDTFSRGSIET